MSDANDSFLTLEKQRLQLEENVKQLKKALQHWQTWDAEYEALKEEVEAIPGPCKPDDLHKIHAEFDGELLIGREIDDVFGFQHSKTRDQIINVLQRRIDYVGKNVASLEKQLEIAENKYAAAAVIDQPDAVDEDGQPITEILEELDDDDNVVSYRLNQPGNSLSQVQKTLEKAGVLDLPSDSSTVATTEAATSVSSHHREASTATSNLPESTLPGPSKDPLARKTTTTTTIPTAAPSVKKSVSFSEEEPAGQPPSATVVARAKRVDRIMKTAKEQESISKQDPIIPEDEDEDDAELRRQMLQYSMGQVGAVVAEIDLEEDVSGDDDDQDSGFEYGEDDDFNDDDEDDDGEEDGFGRFTGRVITDKYRRRMLELEQKLGVKSRFTEQAERKEASQLEDDQGGIGRIIVKPETDSASASRSAPPKSNLKESCNGVVEEKRSVRFAQALDIAPEAEAEAEAETMSASDQKARFVDPLSDVVERTTQSGSSEAKQIRKQSRFKMARDVNPLNESGIIPKGPFDVPTDYGQQEQRRVPTGPKGSTIADKLVERDTPSNVIAPDEFDDTMAHQEVADEYHRMRRKFIYRDGGFLREDESIIQPLDEADDAEPVSRFKAARLSRH